MSEAKTLDASGLKCPLPIVKAKKEIEALGVGEVLKVIATDPGSVLDFQGWVKTNPSKYELVGQEQGQDAQARTTYIHLVRRKA
jgi:TusA-related sulfurtransferase